MTLFFTHRTLNLSDRKMSFEENSTSKIKNHEVESNSESCIKVTPEEVVRGNSRVPEAGSMIQQSVSPPSCLPNGDTGLEERAGSTEHPGLTSPKGSAQDSCPPSISVTDLNMKNEADQLTSANMAKPSCQSPGEGPPKPARSLRLDGRPELTEPKVGAWEGLTDVPLAPAEKLWSSARDEPVRLRMSESGPGSETPLTVYQMFEETVRDCGNELALAAKKNGVWLKLTYQDYFQQCRAAAKSFLVLGLERYHGVGILGFNSPEWFIADIGCIMAGGLAVGIYTTNSPEACQYVANNCEANVLVVENHKQLQKILQVKDQLPHLKAIVQYKDELQQKLPNLYTWEEFIRLGKDVPDEDLNAVIESQRPNECCTLIYTSGTTGNSKGVMLSHDNITWLANAAGEMTKVEKAAEAVVSYLPLSHVAAQVNDMWICLKFAGSTYFADPDALKGSLVNTMKEVRPTTFLGVPRVWEKMQESMKAAGAKTTGLKKRLVDWAKSVGFQASVNIMNGNQTVPWGFMLANNLVFKKVRLALGLDRCRFCFTGAAPIAKDTLDYFMSLHIPLLELYGMSESTGPHTISLDAFFRTGSCGKVLTGCRTKLDKPDEDGNGEVCFWGRHVFMGYLNMPEKTEETLDQEGWLHSGDLGKHDSDGFLFITGRIKELIITAGGENIPPVPIEDALKAEVPIISNAILVGDKKKFLSMLLTLKSNVDDSGEPTDQLTPAVVDFCQKHGVTAQRIADILEDKESAVYRAIQEGMDRVNAKAASNAQRVQKWTILARDFSITGGELGPTMKLKRPVVVKMYKEEIDNFYGA